ncbi:PREDICTED: disease resistance protein TAO1-like [Brassica oleracea var. oleracea]|uniref:disease resistance protein TAO1-like n=1 Tax=Brassica oleracea var. oleracea TaxID=109376 RepID=UPI0006A6FFC3|nr:PREDICTED: disease resistance protein TAO1-like [Brassica oleracea var. oleracea]
MWMNRVDILDLSLRKPVWGRSVEDVEKWKRALDEVSNIFGYRSKGLYISILTSSDLSLVRRNEAEMIKEVANDLSNMLNKVTPSREFDGLVGIENHITQISSLYSVDDVRMVGIWGPAGIGKTTIARALHRKLSSNFTHSAFMESTRGSRETHHPFILKQYFNVLLVLDDVYDSRQLKAMADETQSFRYGSRIIITTNDKKLLKAHGINHVNFPCSSEALEIFCLSAFDQKSPYVGFEELAKEITGFAGNLPLGLNVYGSYLRGMSKGEWIHAFPRLRTSLHTNIEKVIRRDYETLCNKNKDLFLHIACFFKGENTSNLGDYFSNLDIRRGLQVLVEKSLIFKDNNGARLVMHNLLEQLGIEISRKEYIDENGRRAREICDVLNDDRGSGSVRGTDHVLTAIKDDISIGERAYERTIDALPTLSLLPSSSTHQIFISFREADVRDSFLSHMLMVLRNKGITQGSYKRINDLDCHNIK